MNIVYAIRESPNRWAILAGLSFTVGLVGTMMIIAYNWDHSLGRIWFIAFAAAAVYCLIRLVLQVKEQVDESANSPPRDAAM